MTTKQPKLKKPSDADLRSNPLIGGSKGMAMSGSSADDLDEFQGANTLERRSGKRRQRRRRHRFGNDS
jgi:hypothetical protein